MKEGSLKKSGKAGLGWSFMIQGGTQAINFIVSVLLARLLLPEEFGLIGMISIFISISTALVDGGFSSSLIRTKDADNTDYSTVFFVNLITSILLYILLFFIAPYVSEFYEEPILTSLIRVLSSILIIRAFVTVQSTKLNKELKFKTQFKLQFPSLVISAALSIWMAYNNYGVWSIVAKDITYSLLATIQLWWYGKWTPSFIFDKEKFKYHFNFGYKISLTRIFDTSFNNLYNIIIGKYFSAGILGFYTRAKSLEELPTSFFYNAFNRVFYPLLAKINDDNERLKKIYGQLMRIVVFVVTPILIYLGIVAEPLFRWLLTEKWLPAVPYFQLLIIAGVFFPIQKYNLNICQLKGRSDIVLRLSVLQNSLFVMGGLTAIPFGIYGLLYSLIFINIFTTLINAFFSGRLIGYTLRSQVKDLYSVFVLNFVLGILFYIIQFFVNIKIHDLLYLITIALIFFSLYGLLAYLFKMTVLNELLIILEKRNGAH